MPSSWTQNYYHAVFRTKLGQPFLTPGLERRLYPFIGGIARDLGCTLIAGDGDVDHSHVLVRYPADLSHSDMLRHIKSRSSKWVHQTFRELRDFGWQEGYGGFTVSRSMLATVERYIRGQKQKHKRMSFRDEFRALLVRHGIEFDEDDVFRAFVRPPGEEE